MTKKDHQLTFLIPFGILAANTFVFGVIRGMIGRRTQPTVVQWFLMEFIATLEYCVACDELGVIGEKHGMAAMGLTLFIMCYLWCRTWFKASATPCEPIEDLVYKQDKIKNISARLSGQMLAAVVAFRYSSFIWSFHLIPEHKDLHHSHTHTPLQVSLWMGFLIEGTITLISRLVQLESSRLEGIKQDIVNSMTTVALVLAAADSTGGFFNPALATALKVHCRALSYKQLIVAYWSAAICGDLAATFVHKTLHKIEPRVSHMMQRRASTPSTRYQSSQSSSESSSLYSRKRSE